MALVDLEGRRLGEFTLRERIGAGGFAVVHRADQPALEREAVVKMLHERLAQRSDIAQRFLREARLASRLDHPYAAHVYAFGAEPDGTLWIAMELVRGTPMDKLLDDHGPIALDKLVPLFERICEVVQTAHEHGIVHRDIKPGNVMVLSRAGRLLPKLLDFGIARVLDDPVPVARPAASTPRMLAARSVDGHETTEWVNETPDGTAQGSVMGSPAYMAPEQWADAATVGPACDIYALGVLLYQALVGCVPFRGSTESVMMAHLSDAPPSLGERFPAAIDAVIARALAKHPRDRYASAGELAAALRAAAGVGDGEILPQLAEPLREALVQGAVQPLAEAIATLDSARNIDQACASMWDVVVVAIRWVGILAIASRSSVGPGAETDADDVQQLLRGLARAGLDDEDWLALAHALTRPFVDKRDVYPIPELVALLHGGDFTDAYRRLAALRGVLDRRAGRTHEQRRALYADALAVLSEFLKVLVALSAYVVTVPRGGRNERWAGVRRSPRPAAGTQPLLDGTAVLLAGDDRCVLQLAPLVQVAAPAPGRDDELFVFEGRGARGARLVALPYGFEHADPSLFEWFRDALVTLDDDPGTSRPDVAPYRGLMPFGPEDAASYFGREREIEVLVNRLRVDTLVAVVGPSGSGKSSLVQAGVIPRLPADWRAIVVRPGASPLARLEASLQNAGVDARDLADDPSGLADALRDAAARDGSTIVLVIDQLEELFTLCSDERERNRFAAALADATRSELDPVRVVVTVRDDFLFRTGNLPVLGERVVRGLQLLATPNVEALQRILVEPARRAGYVFEDNELIAEMVDAVAGQPGALALLSFTAAELWKLRDRHFRRLTRKAYVASGGVGGALAGHAEQTLDGLQADDRRLVRQAFRHLVTSEGTRQVLAMAELHQLLAPTSSRARAVAVVDRLIAARLLVTTEDVAGDRVEIIHEALLTAWPTLVTWRREDAEGARLRDQLRVAARQWDARGRPHGLLWRGDALTELRLWRNRHPGTITEVEEAFAAASLRDAMRGRRIRRSLGATAFLVAAIGLAVMLRLCSQANEQRAIAETELTHANLLRGQQALLAGNFATAREALGQVIGAGAETVPVRYMMARARDPIEGVVATLEPPGRYQMRDVTFSPDGTRILTSGRDPAARIWSATGAPIAALGGHAPQVYAAWLPDGGIATVDAAGVLRLWSGDGALRSTTNGPARAMQAIAVRSDGALIATGSGDGTVAIWDGHTGAALASWSTGSAGIASIAFAPRDEAVLVCTWSGVASLWTLAGTHRFDLRGHKLALSYGVITATKIVTASRDGTARIWDARDGTLLRVLRGHDAGLTHVAIDPSARYVATASVDATARVWGIDDGELVATLRGHTGQVNWIEFVDENVLVTASSDGTVRVWDPLRGMPTAVLEHGGYVARAHVDRSHTRLVTAGWWGTGRVWDLSRQRRVQRFAHPLATHAPYQEPSPIHVAGTRVARFGARGAVVWELGSKAVWTREGGPVAGDLTSDGRTLVLGDATGTLHVIDLDRDRALLDIAAHQAAVVAVAVDPSARRIASASAAGELVLHDLATGRRLATYRVRAVNTLQFSRDGGALFAYDAESEDARSGWLIAGDQIHRLDHRDRITAYAFAPDGSRLATASWRDGVVSVWAADGHAVLTLDHTNPIVALAWSPDGRWIMTGGGGGTVTIWDASSGVRIRELDAHTGYITAFAFDPSGSLFATASGHDHVVKVWSIDSWLQVYGLECGPFTEQVVFHGSRMITVEPSGADVWNNEM